MTVHVLIAVEGVVQGVGFRPFVYNLATTLNLCGSVRNNASGVLIDVQGEAESIDHLVRHLTSCPPPLAAIERVVRTPASLQSCSGFAITASDPGSECQTLVSADVAVCAACLDELGDPRNRRYRYPFITCTHCGPRFTIVRDVPYDRPRTTMAGFEMCALCRREYEDPRNRRFHAQPIACWDCGPTLELSRSGGEGNDRRTGEAALDGARARLLAGEVVAVKGLGGYHLACDATNPAAVSRLRARKLREAKPLAIMVADLQAAQRVCVVDADERALLESLQRPIVLLRKRVPSDVADEVAPGNRYLGVMLPYTPLHHLLLREVKRPLVMTSGNRTDEPIAFDDEDARKRLADVADVFLLHDRPIETRCDDSVVLVVGARAGFVRRSRGHAPHPVQLHRPFARPVLAVGGHLKNTFCFGRGSYAFLSHHIGDLENLAAYRALKDGVDHYSRLFDIRPEVVAHDLHPDYLSTRLAEEYDVERVAVQHHHAHVASCVAEHGVSEPVIGVAFDGTGLGTDGAIWGGEFLMVDEVGYQRLAHLAYVALPGGDAAVRHPWKMAAAHLWEAYGRDIERLPIPFLEQIEPREWSLLKQMLKRGLRCTPTSSVGRLFDAVAALVGIRRVAQYEAQAALELEMAADPETDATYPTELREAGDGWIVDVSPLIRSVVRDVANGRSAAEVAGAFHNAVRDLIVQTVNRIRRRVSIGRVALTGGVFQNALLLERAMHGLAREGFEVLVHRQVPCNDGGLSLGQAVIADRAAARGQSANAPEVPAQVESCV